MANGNFVVQNGLQVGPLTIDAATGAITTTGNITTTGTTTTFINEVVTGTEAVYGILTANSGTTSTSTTTGAFQVVGGAGITGNVYIGGITNHTGNVAFDGTQVTHYDSIIDIHTYGNLVAWATDDGKDIGLRMHYYKGADKLAFFGWENTTETLQYLQDATETNSNVSGTFGNVKFGSLTLSNSTASSSTTTGALVVTGGAGIAGAVYTGSVYDNGTRVVSTSSGTGNLSISAGAITLPATGPGAASVGSSTAIPVITTDAYGRVSATSTAAVVAPAGTLSGATLASGVTASSLTSVGTIATGTWSASFGAVSGANLTSLTAGNLSGTIPSGVLGNSTLYVGTTAVTLNRASGSLALTGITSIDGAAPAGSLSGSTLASGVTASSLTSVGTLTGLTVSGAIVPNSNVSINLGSTSAWWNIIYGKATQAQYADLAENYQADSAYQAGQVLEFGGTHEVTLATPDTKRVAGVVSTNPAHLMNGGLQGINVIPLALQGRVPCNVIGPVTKGDIMVSAGFGYAKPNNNAQVGQVIGKALADFSGAKGVIEVVVGRQ